MAEKKFVPWQEVCAARDEMDEILSTFQTEHGFDAPIMELNVDWISCATGRRPIMPTFVFTWTPAHKLDRLEPARLVLDKARELMEAFPFTGWYVEKKEK